MWQIFKDKFYQNTHGVRLNYVTLSINDKTIAKDL